MQAVWPKPWIGLSQGCGGPKTAVVWNKPQPITLRVSLPRHLPRRMRWPLIWLRRLRVWSLTVNPNAQRGEIWKADTGGKKHTVVIISLDSRNRSDKVDSVRAVSAIKRDDYN